ncbi:MAG: hypothetical protein ACREML_12215, partial [Vulcanimicrobiaceae bacterium]
MSVLRADRLLHITTALVALSAYAAATAFGSLDPRNDWPALWAFAILAVALPRVLPWWPNGEGNATWRHAITGVAVIAIPTLWSGADWLLALTAVLVAAGLLVARARVIVLVLAAGVLFAHVFFVTPVAGVLVAAAAVLAVNLTGRTWRLHPRLFTWSALGAVLVACAYAFTFEASTVALRLPAEIVAIAIAYAGICILAGRIRRAELRARPEGLLSLPQSIVPLLDRSHHHAIICWFT